MAHHQLIKSFNHDHCRCHGRCMYADPYKISFKGGFPNSKKGPHTYTVCVDSDHFDCRCHGQCMYADPYKNLFKWGFAIGSAYIHRLCRQWSFWLSLPRTVYVCWPVQKFRLMEFCKRVRIHTPSVSTVNAHNQLVKDINHWWFLYQSICCVN